MIRRPPRSPLFPSPTLFRSWRPGRVRSDHRHAREPTEPADAHRHGGSEVPQRDLGAQRVVVDRKSTRLNSSHLVISYAVFCLKKKTCNIKHSMSCLRDTTCE